MDGILCGFAQKEITPLGDGIFLDGYGHRMSPAEGVSDPLYVKAAVFGRKEEAEGEAETARQAACQFAIVVLDVCGFHEPIYELLADYVEAMTGLEPGQVAICATHTHAAPACGVLDGLPINWDYWGYAAETAGRTILEAMGKMEPCSCYGAVSDREFVPAHNRRDRPFIDRRMKALVFTGLDGRVRGILASASCHPVIQTSLELSADYPRVLTRRAMEEYGVPCIFLQGRCGDINPSVPEGMGIQEAIERVGSELAEGILSAVDKGAGKGEVPSSVDNCYWKVRIPMKVAPQPEEARRSFEGKLKEYLAQPWSLEKHYAFREAEWHRKRYRSSRCGGDSGLWVPIQMLDMGHRQVFLFLPFEILTSTGNKAEEILGRFGYGEENIFVVGYANCVNGYLAPGEEFALGGYEVTGAAHWYGLPECSEETEKAVLEAVEQMAGEMLGRKT